MPNGAKPSMKFINDADAETRERLRREILGGVESRREEAHKSFSFLINFMGLVLSGATIAVLSFLAQRATSTIPPLGVASFIVFATALLSFAVFLHWHYTLHNARWNHYAEVAQGWFLRKNSMEDLLEAQTALQSKWLFRLIFWVPFSLAVLGFLLGAAAVVTDWPNTLPSGAPIAGEDRVMAERDVVELETAPAGHGSEPLEP